MKKLVVAMMLSTLVGTQLSHANVKSQSLNTTLSHIVSLAEQGEQMNLKKTAQVLGQSDLYGKAIFNGELNDGSLRYTYHVEQKDSPLTSVAYTIWLDMNSGFNEVTGVVEFDFKKEQCPTAGDLERVTGAKAMTTYPPTSPDLITGKGGSYTMHLLTTKTGKTLSLVGCRVSVASEAKLS